MLTLAERRGTTLRPFVHDCEECEWVGWFVTTGVVCNVYLHDRTVVIRYGDEGSEYWSATAGFDRPHAIGVSG